MATLPACMASMARLARSATGAGTVTRGERSRRQSRRFASVAFFMLGHTMPSSIGWKTLDGFSFLRRWSIPTSVPTMISGAEDSRAYAHMPPVERRSSAASRTSFAHSGCTRTGAPGCAARAAATRAAVRRACVGQ